MYKAGGFSACDVNLIYTIRHKGRRDLGKEIIVSNLPNMVSELQLGADKHTSAPKILTSEFLGNNGCDNKVQSGSELRLKRAL